MLTSHPYADFIIYILKRKLEKGFFFLASEKNKLWVYIFYDYKNESFLDFN